MIISRQILKLLYCTKNIINSEIYNYYFRFKKKYIDTDNINGKKTKKVVYFNALQIRCSEKNMYDMLSAKKKYVHQYTMCISMTIHLQCGTKNK